MKKHLIFWTLAVTALSSCGKINSDGLYSRAYGEEVVFSLSNTSSPLKTKAEYSGVIDSDKIERIDWVEGEQISIACAQTENNFFNYTVASVQTDGHESEASVTHAPGSSGLRWKGDDTYNFYAVSPYSSTLTMNGVAVFTLPTAQSFDSSKSGWNTGHSNFKAAVSPAYMQMTAKQSVIKSGDDPSDPVDLPFMILPTVLEFTLSGEADMVVDQVKLESSSTPLTGQYQVYIDQNESAEHPEYPRIYIQRPEDVTKSASMVLRESGEPVEVKTGEDITFTFMLLPKDIKDLTFFLTREDESGDPYTVKTKLSYADGTALEFDAHKKYLIKGMIVPEGVKWTINYDPTVQSWDQDDENINPMPEVGLKPFVTSWDPGINENLDIQVSYTYEFGLPNASQALQSFVNTNQISSTESIIINSTKTAGGGTATDANWTIKSYKIGSADPVAVGGTSFTDKGGLNVTKVGNNLQVNATARSQVYPGKHDYWVNQNPARTENLDWSPGDWSTQGTIDLSKFDYSKDTPAEAIGAHAMTTANSYIIRHAGTYKIPLVYGNGVVGGNVNTRSYAPMLSGNTQPLTPFVNYLNEGITSPFIENNTNCIPTGCAVLWQDEDVVVKDLAIIGAAASSYDASNVRYLQFTVDQTKICQNNAVICIYKDLNGNGSYDRGEAIWSWLIWTTNNPALLSDAISVTNHSGNVYRFFPIYSIGHVDGYNYPGREKVIITLEQEESGNTIDIIVNQPLVLGPSSGNYYQFGRKDPMCRKDNPAAGAFYIKDASVDYIYVNRAISEPDTFYGCRVYHQLSGWYTWAWPNSNLWSGSKATYERSYENDSEIFKTIYDPSPVGYKMPASKAFTGFTTTGEGTYSQEDFNVISEFKSGYYFYTDATKSDVILFPASGYRHSESGDVIDFGLRGSYWSAVSGNESSGYQTLFYQGYDGSAGIAPANFERRANGQSVRPVLE